MSIENSSTFRAAQDGFGEYYHGQTILYYDENGNLEKREEQPMVLLWSNQQSFDKDLFTTFLPIIEIKKERQKEDKGEPPNETPELGIPIETCELGTPNEIPELGENTLKRSQKDENTPLQPKHHKQEKEIIDDQNASEPSDYICVFTENGTLIHTVPIFIKKKHSLKEPNATAENVDEQIPGRSFISYETILVASCQMVEEQLGATINYRAFKLYDKVTNSEIQMNDPITIKSPREITIKMSKGNTSDRSSRSSSQNNSIKIL